MRNSRSIPGAENAPNRFIPASRYHGDRYPRTMEQAFGPGARLSPTEHSTGDAFVAAVICGVLALLGLAAALS